MSFGAGRRRRNSWPLVEEKSGSFSEGDGEEEEEEQERRRGQCCLENNKGAQVMVSPDNGNGCGCHHEISRSSSRAKAIFGGKAAATETSGEDKRSIRYRHGVTGYHQLFLK